MGGKKDRSEGLGRALMRQHNKMVQESKEKGRAIHRQQKKFLESVIDVSDIDAVLEKAEEADRNYSIGNAASSDVLINLDSSSEMGEMTVNERQRMQKEEEALHAGSLRVPRRPPWNAQMSVEELDVNERRAFLEWRRNLARLEENERLVLTPFEKNLDIWRQLWRVLERSDLLVMVVDARDPLFYRCPDLEEYALEIDEHRRTLLLVNKADLLPLSIRKSWAEYFCHHEILYVFWSAKAASAALEGKKLSNNLMEDQLAKESDSSDLETKIYGREELLARLQTEAEAIVAKRRPVSAEETDGADSSDSCSVHSTAKHVVVGFVGYPNVGKSSTINALVGQKRTGVTSTPGKTKHFQTLIISDELVLCDCPGLVFPSFSSSRHEMVASGVLPIDRMMDHRAAVQIVANRVPRHILSSIYNITLPKPKPYEPQSRPPLAAELLRAYCSSRGHVSSSGLPDETRAARQILKDYIDGKLPHFEMPPGTTDGDMEVGEAQRLEGPISLTSIESDSSDSDGQEEPSSSSATADAANLNLEDALDELESFDLTNEISTNAAATKKKSKATSHKHHKKPQKKKDRSWRVGNDNGDGMPVVRVFQKPAVSLKAVSSSE